MATVPVPTRGEIWLVNFDPAVGGEIRKLRPALVIGVDAIGKLPLRIIVPVTDWKPHYAGYPWFVEIRSTSLNGLVKDSGADAFQVKSLSIDRFVRCLGSATREQTDDTAAAVALCIGVP